MDCWHILTGEYPPQAGGVSDYSAMLAKALAGSGAEVHVWAPGAGDQAPPPGSAGVAVHREAGRWSAADLGRLGRALDDRPSPRRLLLQYTPNTWGYKGLNFGFCRWVAGRAARGDEIRLMVHEPFYPWQLRDRPTRWILAAGQRRMIRSLLASSGHVYVSIPAWGEALRRYMPPRSKPAEWLPVPSNVPVVDDDGAVAALKHRLAPAGETIVGSFGTYGPLIAPTLAAALVPLLAGRPARKALLLGRGGGGFADALRAAHPELGGRLIASGGLPPAELSIHLQVCDLLVQPYPGGANSRRGSLMAGLAHGLPAATTLGRHSEPLWAATGCIAPAPDGDGPALARLAEALLDDPDALARIGAAARTVYDRHFTIERTVARLRGNGATATHPA